MLSKSPWKNQVQKISSALESVKPFITYDFCRKPRGLKEVKRWKTTEYRQFLLYTGPVILKDILNTDLYNNFLLLHCAVTNFAEKSEKPILQYAKDLLISFVKSFFHLYGKQYASFNIHGLLHMHEDVSKFGTVDKYSAFQFENYMQEFKKKK